MDSPEWCHFSSTRLYVLDEILRIVDSNWIKASAYAAKVGILVLYELQDANRQLGLILFTTKARAPKFNLPQLNELRLAHFSNIKHEEGIILHPKLETENRI